MKPDFYIDRSKVISHIEVQLYTSEFVEALKNNEAFSQLERLLNLGVNLWHKDEHEHTLVQIAAKLKRYDIVDLLYRKQENDTTG